MPTVNKKFVDNLIAGKGHYNGDSTNTLGDNPRCVEITQYTDMGGDLAYGLTFDGEDNKYWPSEFVVNPRQYWRYVENE